MKIFSTNTVHQDGIKMLVYGVSGAGKTFMLQTAPNPFILSSESGLLSLAGCDIPAAEITSEKALKEAYDYCLKSDYDTICIDSISDIAESLLAEYKGKFSDGRQSYGALGDTMNKYLRLFRDIKGKNVVFIAKEVSKETSGVTTAAPSMPGQSLTTNIPYVVDLVLRIVPDKKGNRLLHTKSTFTQICKDRSGKLDATEEPNLGSIISKITGVK